MNRYIRNELRNILVLGLWNYMSVISGFRCSRYLALALQYRHGIIVNELLLKVFSFGIALVKVNGWIRINAACNLMKYTLRLILRNLLLDWDALSRNSFLVCCTWIGNQPSIRTSFRRRSKHQLFYFQFQWWGSSRKTTDKRNARSEVGFHIWLPEALPYAASLLVSLVRHLKNEVGKAMFGFIQG